MEPKFWELIIVLAIIVLLFGPNRLAGLGGAVGRSMREFRSAMRSDDAKPGGPSPDDARTNQEPRSRQG